MLRREIYGIAAALINISALSLAWLSLEKAIYDQRGCISSASLLPLTRAGRFRGFHGSFILYIHALFIYRVSLIFFQRSLSCLTSRAYIYTRQRGLILSHVVRVYTAQLLLYMDIREYNELSRGSRSDIEIDIIFVKFFCRYARVWLLKADF